jgi:UDP-glucose 4-epimerase
MRVIRLGGTFEIYGDGTQVRDYVNAADVVSAFRLALTDESWRGPVVIGSGASLSVLDVLEAIRTVTGAEFDVRHGPAKPGEMPAVIVDPSNAHAKGWTPRFTFEDGLAGVWEEWSKADPEVIAAGAPAAPVTAGERTS